MSGKGETVAAVDGLWAEPGIVFALVVTDVDNPTPNNVVSEQEVTVSTA